MQKARGQAFLGRSQGIALPLLVSIRFQVLFHSPRRGAFHLSLTVLVHYRSLRSTRLGGWSPHVQTGFHVSRPTRVLWFVRPVRGCHPSRRPFQTVPVNSPQALA